MNTPKSKILFVDDESQILETLKLVFRGWNIATTTSAKEALKLLQSETFSVIVSDQRMPEMTGVEFLKEAKKLSPKSVRILLTGYSELDNVIDAINSGEVYRFISKPWDNDKLKETVETACKIAELDTDLKEEVEKAKGKKAETVRDGGVELLFIDKLDSHLQGYKSLFEGTYTCHTAQTIEDAYTILAEHKAIGVVACDSTLASSKGTIFLTAIRTMYPDLVTIFMSDSKDAQEAIKLINDGQIFRYLVKPFPRDVFRQTIEDAVAKHTAYQDNPLNNIKRKEDEVLQSGPVQSQMPLNDFLADIRSKVGTKKSY
ncbi:MAG: response regulator [Chloroherpetonaceae bacterium]